MKTIPEEFDEFTIIVKNSAKCLKCDTILESKYRHDFVTCKCGSLSVDGGHSYLKRCGDFNNSEELSESRHLTLEEITKEMERWLSLSRSEFGTYYKDKLERAKKYREYLLFGEQND